MVVLSRVYYGSRKRGCSLAVVPCFHFCAKHVNKNAKGIRSKTPGHDLTLLKVVRGGIDIN